MQTIVRFIRENAARDTVHATLGEGLSMDAFRPIYDELRKPVYHPFTTDNQD